MIKVVQSLLNRDDMDLLEASSKHWVRDYPQWHPRELKRLAQSPAFVLLLAIGPGDRFVGMALFSLSPDFADLLFLFSELNSRRIGTATALMNHFVSSPCAEKLNEIYLEVKESNQGAIDFYSKNGFATLSIRKRYYKDGHNALVMKRVLNR